MDAFYALAEPNRRRIMEILASSGELPASEICGKFNVTAQAVSQHLKILLEVGLLSMEKRSQQRIYQINADSMQEVEDWIERTRQLWTARLDRLDRLLEAEKKKNAKTK